MCGRQRPLRPDRRSAGAVRRPTDSTSARPGRVERPHQAGDGAATPRPGLAVDLDVELQAVGPVAPPEGLMGKGTGGGKMDGSLGEGEGVLVPVHARDGGAGQAAVLRSEHRIEAPGRGQLDPAEADLGHWAGGDPAAEGGRQLLGTRGTRRARASRRRPPPRADPAPVASHGWATSSWTPIGPPITTSPAIPRWSGRSSPRSSRTTSKGRPARPRASHDQSRALVATCWRITQGAARCEAITPWPPRGRPRPDARRAGRRPGPCPTSRFGAAPRGAHRRRPDSGASAARPAWRSKARWRPPPGRPARWP